MECNRDEALKAKSVAEMKLERKDYDGAKKFALKAQSMYPGLDGISQMLATVDVLVSAEKKINGEMDWYAVLSVKPSADDDAIRKQYLKLALLVHPDKNKCIGTDGAFKLIGEAWGLLSNKAKRSAYDHKTGVFRAPNATGSPKPAKANGFHNFSGAGSSSSFKENRPYHFNSRAKPFPNPQNANVFHNFRGYAPPVPNVSQIGYCRTCNWYFLVSLTTLPNGTVLCPNCKVAFMESPVISPFFNMRSSNQQYWQHVPCQYPARNYPPPAAPKCTPPPSKKASETAPSPPANASGFPDITKRSDDTSRIVSCPKCKMKYDYQRLSSLNGTLFCPICKETFVDSGGSVKNQVPRKPIQDPGKNIPAAQRSGPGKPGFCSVKPPKPFSEVGQC